MMRTFGTQAWRRFGASVALAAALAVATSSVALAAPADDGKNGNNSVAARLGGFNGILGFLSQFVVPAFVSDPIVAPFFVPNIKEPAGDIEQCFAMLLDHDLGGSSPHFGAVLADQHQCRSSMSNIHRGFNIPDRVIDRFIAIVGEQAAIVGVADADIQEVAKVLNSYRGGVRNK